MNVDIHEQRILILDFGSQYTQLIARRVRELGVYCELHACDIDAHMISDFSPSGIILSGGPQTVTGADTLRVPDMVFELGCPVFGICYGMQAMATHFGGKVVCTGDAGASEYGHAQLTLLNDSPLFHDVDDHINDAGERLIDVWMSHGDKVVEAPEGFSILARSDDCDIAAMADESRRCYGVQFHPEVTHTRQGQRILEHFIIDICGCTPLWSPHNIAEDAIETVRAQVGRDRVLLGLSGGVDSSVVAALLHKAIGEQLLCVFVDNGLLRLNEVAQVENVFKQHFGIELITVDAKQRFLSALQGVDDPEKKRKIIGELFVRVFEEVSEARTDIKWLAQGTIYPDVIESAGAKSGKAAVIKSHHNVGGLPDVLKLSLIEPLRELFKDEVRKLGTELGLPADIVFRHPFPGPGLSVRILGEVKAPYVDTLQRADAIFIEELRAHDLYDKVQQAFAVFLPVKSVGVVGDQRRYAHVIALRAVETVDYMTANWAALPHAFLAKVSNRIINEIEDVSRVVYDISGKPPATIEWE